MSNRRPEGDTPFERSLDEAADRSGEQISRMFAKNKEDAILREQLAAAESRVTELEGALKRYTECEWDDIEGQPMMVKGPTPSGIGIALISPAEFARQALSNSTPTPWLRELVKAATLYARLAHRNGKDEHSKEKGRHGDSTPWAELCIAVANIPASLREGE